MKKILILVFLGVSCSVFAAEDFAGKSTIEVNHRASGRHPSAPSSLLDNQHQYDSYGSNVAPPAYDRQQYPAQNPYGGQYVHERDYDEEDIRTKQPRGSRWSVEQAPSIVCCSCTDVHCGFNCCGNCANCDHSLLSCLDCFNGSTETDVSMSDISLFIGALARKVDPSRLLDLLDPKGKLHNNEKVV